MHSIRTKITFLTISAILICSLLIGAVSVATVKRREEESSEQLMNVICEAKRDKIDYYLNSIEEAVGTIVRFIYDSLDAADLAEGGVIGATGSGRSLNKRERSPEQRAALDECLSAHLPAVRDVFETVAGNNASVLSYYYRINPEFSDAVTGFWYSRHDGVKFRELAPTDIDRYQTDDFAHVGWYYLPLERGRPSWIDPYENKNLGETIVSYVAPLYRAGTFIGVIGMDVSFSTMVEQINGLAVLETGYAFLTDGKGKILYHPMMQSGTLLSDVNDELKAAEKSENDGLIEYTLNGAAKKAAWRTLTNGMRLIVSVPVREIDAGWLSLTRFILVSLATILAFFILLTFSLVKHITMPLEHLAKASEQLAAGNYDVELSYQGDDEVGALTRAFAQMAKHLRAFIHDLNSKAYRDALTGVRNKGAFDIFTYKLDEQIRQSEQGSEPRFAVAMFDCDDLKLINDSYGHEKGDLYLQTACRLICRTFSHSPVFRVGGDEFAAILQNEDLARQEALELRFKEEAVRLSAGAANPWERVSVAVGLAEFEPRGDRDVESVLRRADTRMYWNKKEHKKSSASR